MTAQKPDREESKLETGISYLLITGVILSLLLEVIGLVLYFYSYHNLSISSDPAMYIRGHDFFSFIFQQFLSINMGNIAILFMTAGIIVLILTPYVRVIASVIYFGWQKNIKYVVITLFVLIVVSLSLVLH
ncbi:MAG: DUF1634 domain-containing protein [Dehalococcoidia bacterium]|jgi:uncharacterized membrane protein